MSRQYGFNRNVNAVRRLLAELEKRIIENGDYHEIAHELVKMGLVTSTNGAYKPTENAKGDELKLLVDRLNARSIAGTCCGLIETGCTLTRYGI